MAHQVIIETGNVKISNGHLVANKIKAFWVVNLIKLIHEFWDACVEDFADLFLSFCLIWAQVRKCHDDLFYEVFKALNNEVDLGSR